MITEVKKSIISLALVKYEMILTQSNVCSWNNSLPIWLSFKDDEIQKQARLINQLKEQLGEQEDTLKSNQVDTEKLQSQINVMQSESETSKTEVKEVLQALEELAVNYDQKLQEVETKTKDNDKLSEELSQKQVQCSRWFRCDFCLALLEYWEFWPQLFKSWIALSTG